MSRLDLVWCTLVSLAVGGAMAWVVEPWVAVAAGGGVLLVVVLATTCLRLTRALQDLESGRVTERVVEVARPAPTVNLGARWEEWAERVDAVLRQLETMPAPWHDAQRQATEFRRGLVKELAVSFDDLQARMQELSREADERISSLDRELKDVRKGFASVRNEVRAIPRNVDLLHQVEAMVALRVTVSDERAPLPLSGEWRASPTTLLRYVQLIATTRPGLVVECGSGVSSVWAGLKLRELGAGRCVALEHERPFQDESSGLVAVHGLQDVVEIRWAPLTEGPAPWYDAAALDDLREIDVVFVDGPPGPVAPAARAPALEMLGPRMRVGGHILMDDSHREDEARIIESWLTTGLVRVVDSAPDAKGWTLLQYVGDDTQTSDQTPA